MAGRVTDDGWPVHIEVVCGECGKGIDTFTRREDGTWRTDHSDQMIGADGKQVRMRSGTPSQPLRRLPPHRLGYLALHHDLAAIQAAEAASPSGDLSGAYIRHRMGCCGRELRRRADTLRPRLNTLCDNGIKRITLAGLCSLK